MADDKTEIFKHLSLVTELSLLMVFNILVGFALGFFIDKKYGTFPKFFIPFLILGILSGFWSAYKTIMKNIK